MNRTPEWIIERATARIAGRIEFVVDIKENKDVVLRYDFGNGDVEEVEFRKYSWAERDNTDNSVYKWVNSRTDDFLDKIAKALKKNRDMNTSLRPEDKAGPVLPPPQPRAKGRPPGSKNKSAVATSEIAST